MLRHARETQSQGGLLVGWLIAVGAAELFLFGCLQLVEWLF